jgi:hypothetical protein
VGGGGRIELANFSKLTTILFALFSIAVAMLFAKSAPGIEGAFCVEVGGFVIDLFGVFDW